MNLSTNLVGLDRGILAIQEPLSEFFREIQGVNGEVEGRLARVEGGLARQAALREQRQVGRGI